MSSSLYIDYIGKMKNIEQKLLGLLENEDSQEIDSHIFIHYLEHQKIGENKQDIKEFLHLISEISNYHRHTSLFISKIHQIIKHFEKEIKIFLTNFNIFKIFKRNKRILVFLFEEKIIIPDETIFRFIIRPKYQQRFYPIFFYYEFLPVSGPNFYEEIRFKYPEVKNYDLFKKKQKLGENDNEICSLIRNDSIDDFVSIVNQKNLSLSSQIDPSIYETNLFLTDKKPTLIEYASFFGSIQIFKYLLNNNVKLTSSLWPFVIYSQNSELIQILEENDIRPQNDSFEPSLIESIKCHYIEITQYILDNYLSNYNIFNDKTIFKYYNYYFFSDKSNELSIDLPYFCKYDYFNIVKFLMDSSVHKTKSKKKLLPHIIQIYVCYSSGLYEAVKNENIEIVQILIQYPELNVNSLYILI